MNATSFATPSPLQSTWQTARVSLLQRRSDRVIVVELARPATFHWWGSLRVRMSTWHSPVHARAATR
jgi:hypothetical protein